MPNYVINPLGAPFDATATIAELGLEALYARLDGSNTPFTGNIRVERGSVAGEQVNGALALSASFTSDADDQELKGFVTNFTLGNDDDESLGAIAHDHTFVFNGSSELYSNNGGIVAGENWDITLNGNDHFYLSNTGFYASRKDITYAGGLNPDVAGDENLGINKWVLRWLDLQSTGAFVANQYQFIVDDFALTGPFWLYDYTTAISGGTSRSFREFRGFSTPSTLSAAAVNTSITGDVGTSGLGWIDFYTRMTSYGTNITQGVCSLYVELDGASGHTGGSYGVVIDVQGDSGDNLALWVKNGDIQVDAFGAGFVQTDANGTFSSAAIGTGDLPSTVMLEGENVSLLTNDAGYLTTVDISDDTNLAVTAPIVLTDDTLSLDLTDDFNFTGALQKDGDEINAPQVFNGVLTGTINSGFSSTKTVAVGRSDFRGGFGFLRGPQSVSASNGYYALTHNIRPAAATGALSTNQARGSYSSGFYVTSSSSRASDDIFGSNIYLRNVYFNGTDVTFVFFNNGIKSAALTAYYNFVVW